MLIELEGTDGQVATLRLQGHELVPLDGLGHITQDNVVGAVVRAESPEEALQLWQYMEDLAVGPPQPSLRPREQRLGTVVVDGCEHIVQRLDRRRAGWVRTVCDLAVERPYSHAKQDSSCVCRNCYSRTVGYL